MLLPGPEAQQLATYLGWLMHGVKGGLAAGLLFIIPGAAVMLALSIIYATLGEVPVVAALFFGLKCAVLVLVVEALLRVAKRALKGTAPWAAGGRRLPRAGRLRRALPASWCWARSPIGYAAPRPSPPPATARPRHGPPALLDAALAAEPGPHLPHGAGGAARAGWSRWPSGSGRSCC